MLEGFGDFVQPQKPGIMPYIPDKRTPDHIRDEQMSLFDEEHHKLPKENDKIACNYPDNHMNQNAYELGQNRSKEEHRLAQIMKKINLRPIDPQQSFYCRCAEREQKNETCSACKNTGTINGTNNMVKFFEYVLEFKLGARQSYNASKASKAKQITLLSKKNYPTTSVQQYYTTIAKSKQYDYPHNQSFNTNTSTMGSINDYGMIKPRSQFCQSQVFLSANNEPSEEPTSQVAQPSGRLTNAQPCNAPDGMPSGITSDQSAQQSLDPYLSFNLFPNPRSSYTPRYSLLPTIDHTASLSSARMSLPYRISAPSPSLKSVREYKQTHLNNRHIHQGYRCDSCGMNPIVGSRFHCLDTRCGENYDLCGGCCGGHGHQMEEVRENGMGRVLGVLDRVLNGGERGDRRVREGGHAKEGVREKVGSLFMSALR